MSYESYSSYLSYRVATDDPKNKKPANYAGFS